MKQALNFSQSAPWKALLGFMMRVNQAVIEEHGQGFKGLEFNGKEDTFTCDNPNSRFNGKLIRLNSTVPNAELFSLASELVYPMDEAFEARNAFAIDESFHPGSQQIGYDVVSEQGKAKLVPIGQNSASDTPKADASIGRKFSAVGKIQNFYEVTRDEIQELSLRNDRGLSPLIDLMSFKMDTARKNIARVEDQLVWLGGSFSQTPADDKEIPGYLDSFSTSSALYDGNTPSKGKQEQVADSGTGSSRLWADKTPDNIIADITKGLQYLTSKGLFKPTTLAMPHGHVTDLAMRRVSDVDSTPLLEWIIRTIKSAYRVDLTILGTNALKGTVNTNKDGFLLFESKKQNQAIAVTEQMTVLPSKELGDGTIQQFVLMKTGGIQVKRPSSGYLGTDI